MCLLQSPLITRNRWTDWFSAEGLTTNLQIGAPPEPQLNPIEFGGIAIIKSLAHK